ncbi:MAG: hypothetical protein KJO41_08440 [Bacteroidia bacterium]|nr:hypothetical protein [Bacteroidia bacterium]NND24656.1 hypothetical protein [Flavobacteriaceae bacterium]MBT8279016.1 hypothetical protein [Bacteroidia bacterium]NNK60344.1 hypothetical protein [Flavobacteriaceae bacterium]NNL31829.1 hypothetical protein [Flavobacteriaceae bacterium]
MGTLGDKLKDVEKKSKRTQRITFSLSAIMIIFLALSVFLMLQLRKSEIKLQQSLKEKDSINVALDSTNVELAATQLNLENLIAERQKVELERQKANDDIWNYTKEENTIEGYLNYLNIKGDDVENKDEVLAAINNLLSETGYVQIKESNGNNIFKPSNKLDGYFESNTARSVRRGVIGNPDYPNTSRNGDVILAGQIVKISDTINAGSIARWGKIRYSEN